MNTQSNTMSESLDAPRVAPAAMPWTQTFCWSVRRELWENRSLYIAPLAAAAVFLFGFLISVSHLPAEIRTSLLLNAVQQHAVQQPYMMAAGLLMLTGMIVGVFYSLDALYGERRDRSILFWKSLPVSDVTVVLSKAIIPIFVLQLLAAAITIAVHMIMLLVSSAVLLGSGLSVTTLWTQVAFFHMSFLLLYHLVVLHGLWHAPFYGWFLFVSSWARRAPFVWAVLPPLAIGIVEQIAFNTSHFADLVFYQLGGTGMGASDPSAHAAPIEMLGHFEPLRLLSTPGLWIGLAVTALFLAAAVRLRRYRGPI
jgi:ABC-2 type transport system permease protein